MPTTPALIPVPPTAGGSVGLSTSPFWIGSAPGCPLQLHLPGIAGHHAAILEREDGFWLAPGPGVSPVPTVNGTAAYDEVRLSHGDVIEVAPAARYRFDSGEPPPPEPKEDEPAEPIFAEAPAPRRRRRRRSLSKAQRRRLRLGILASIATVVVLGLLAAAVVMLIRAF
jgi:hypothetical protein